MCPRTIVWHAGGCAELGSRFSASPHLGVASPRKRRVGRARRGHPRSVALEAAGEQARGCVAPARQWPDLRSLEGRSRDGKGECKGAGRLNGHRYIPPGDGRRRVRGGSGFLSRITCLVARRRTCPLFLLEPVHGGVESGLGVGMHLRPQRRRPRYRAARPLDRRAEQGLRRPRVAARPPCRSSVVFAFPRPGAESSPHARHSLTSLHPWQSLLARLREGEVRPMSRGRGTCPWAS